MQTTATVAVAADPQYDLSLRERAAALARQLHLPLVNLPEADGSIDADRRPADLLLVQTVDRLELRVLTGPAELRGGRPLVSNPLSVDITSPRGRSFRQPLARALGLARRSDPLPTVLDATAGWGEDAWLIASLGCTVTAVERHPVMAALLRDGLERAARTHPDVARRITLITADARRAPADADRRFDVVYLDPMFAPGRKTIGRKSMRVVRALVGDDTDSGELFAFALRAAQKRVVVKRPIHAAPLVTEPTLTFKGKSLRYDVYPVAAHRAHG